MLYEPSALYIFSWIFEKHENMYNAKISRLTGLPFLDFSCPWLYVPEE